MSALAHLGCVAATLAAVAACTPPPQTPCPQIPPPMLASAGLTDGSAQPADPEMIKARSHDLFDAVDRADGATLRTMVGASFGRFFAGMFSDTAMLVNGLAARASAHEPVRSRTWADERVVTGTDAAVFIGEAVEHIPAAPSHPAAEVDGYNTLVWSRAGNDWKAAVLTWQPAGIEGARESWNVIYHAGLGFNLQPNQLVVDTVKGKKPGAALDLEMGQGRNAVYLAAQGWKVTGVDISDEGIRIAKDAAGKQKLKLETVNDDVGKYDLGENKWDAVTLTYAGADPALLERIKPAMKKGGVIVVEDLAKDAKAGAGLPGIEAGALAHTFTGWKIVKDEVVEDVADWGMHKAKLQRFVAEKQ